MVAGNRRTWAAAALAVLALIFVLALAVSEARLIGMVAFCLLAPGYGWARRMRLKDRGDTLAMTVVISVCATVLIGTALAVTGAWSPLAGLVFLILIALGGFAPLPGIGPFGKHSRARLAPLRTGLRKYLRQQKSP